MSDRCPTILRVAHRDQDRAQGFVHRHLDITVVVLIRDLVQPLGNVKVEMKRLGRLCHAPTVEPHLPCVERRRSRCAVNGSTP